MSVVRKILQIKTQVLEKLKNRLKLLSNSGVCGKKKSTFIKNQEINSISND